MAELAEELAGFQLDGDVLPPFASEGNKQTDAEVKRKKAELDKVEEKLETDGERIKVMTEHLINVQQELMHTQQLVDAKKGEIDTEEHMKALTSRQNGRIKSEISRLQKLADDYQDRTNSTSNEVFKGNERLDQFKLEMNWNQEELEQWAIAAKQKEEDELTIEKYKRADEAKVRELTLAIEKLTVENAGRRKELEQQVTDTQSKQIEMDKTAEMFRQLHEDRRKLIEQWEEAVNSMKQRDSQLEGLGETYALNCTRKKQKEQKMKERKEYFEKKESENQKMETAIANTERELTRVRVDHMHVKQGIQEFKDEVDILKNQLQAAETEKINTKNKLQVQSRGLSDRELKCGALQTHHENTHKKLQEAQANTKEQEKNSQEAENHRQEMLQQLKSVEKEMRTAKEQLFKESQELYRLRADEATTLGEISGAQSAIKNLQYQINKLDQERLRQQELLYAVDFQSQLMQRKVARVSGERTLEEKEDLNRKIAQLDKQYEDQKGLHTILLAQIKRQDAELKTAQRTLEGKQKESEGMKKTMEELELQNTIMNRTVAQTVKEKEEILVHHDVMRLEVKRIKNSLNSKTESLYSLENRKAQLEISMHEREKEIEVHQEVLKQQLRCAEEERHNTMIELAERKQKIFNLKSKYDTVLNKVKRDEDGDKSQAYYVLKAAQAKEELQRRGDELDEKIRKAEREIRALENTLGHLLTRNKKYKENFQVANSQNQSDLEEKQGLEEQSRAANEVLFKRKKALAQLAREQDEDVKRYEELQSNVSRLEASVGELEQARDSTMGDVEEQRPKLLRAERKLQASKQTAAESGVDVQPESGVTMDIELRAMRDQNQSILFALNNALQEHPEDVLPLFESLCNEKGIALPSRPPSVGSRPGSSRSLMG